MNPKPEIITFLIADQVIQEKGTNKWSAIGIFDHICADQFPFIYQSMGLYIKLTDAQGDYKIRIEIVDPQHHKVSVFEGINLKIDSRLSSMDLGIQTRNLHLPKPDNYHIDLYFNDQLCKSLPLFVTQAVK